MIGDNLIESAIGRIRVCFGHYYCPDCYYPKCTDRCGRVHQEELSVISKAIGRREFDRARELIKKLTNITGEDDPETIRLLYQIEFLEGDD